jgi:hypothetical protein
LAFLNCTGHGGADRISKGDQPKKFELEIVLLLRKGRTGKRCFGDAENAQPFGSHSSDAFVEKRCVSFRQMTEIRDRFGRSFCGYDKLCIWAL